MIRFFISPCFESQNYKNIFKEAKETKKHPVKGAFNQINPFIPSVSY